MKSEDIGLGLRTLRGVYTLGRLGLLMSFTNDVCMLFYDVTSMITFSFTRHLLLELAS